MGTTQQSPHPEGPPPTEGLTTVCQGWSAHNFCWETPLALLVVDWKNKTKNNAWPVLGMPALGVYMS